MEKDLYRRKDDGGSCSTWITLSEDCLRVNRLDTGSAPEQMLGGDYETWITIPRDELSKLAFALLSEKLEGKLSAVGDTEAICKANGVKYERGTWS